MNVLTPHIRQSDPAPNSPDSKSPQIQVIQAELEAMLAIARALANVPEGQARARVIAWASSSLQANPGGGTAVPAATSPPLRFAETFNRHQSVESPLPTAETPFAHERASGRECQIVSMQEDGDALSIKGVDTLFQDARPSQGRFPPDPYLFRRLRPRLVLRFRLWARIAGRLPDWDDDRRD